LERFPEPGKYSWQTHAKDRFQSLERFAAGASMVEADQTICIILLVKNEIESRLVDSISEYVSIFFQMRVVLITANFEDYDFVNRETDTVQYRADTIRKGLRNLIPGNAYCTLIWTDVDLYPYTWFRNFRFIFGEANYGTRVGVFSCYRLDERNYSADSNDEIGGDALFGRSLKVIVHEIGHMFNIDHCIDWNCVMCGINGVSELERKRSLRNLRSLTHRT
jgi:archaemetzincin